ncbi:Hypothetical predicted protein [Lecanosticta acicola]|uniref:HMG box domain-containing protein n=1 Tax=Lecanosticta acicola TaxID=111012 RepID=A0AAI8Z421_9PEZI|nr:Hypothetical predicted protein [Lecanosticta acicola]
MIGRALLRLPVRSRLLRLTGYQCQHGTIARTPTVFAVRTYATPGRPKRVVGEPSRPVKRSVKKAAAKPADGTSAAEKKTAVKKRKAAKKPAAKKQKAPLTVEQKAEKKARSKKRSDAAKLKELKEAALKPPKVNARASPWMVFMQEKLREADPIPKGQGQDAVHKTLAQNVKNISSQFRNLSAAQLEHYNHDANRRKADAEAEYKRWVESHSAEQILRANQARASLRRLVAADKKSTRKASSWPHIRDEREVKRPVNGFTHFTVNRHASGDFKKIAIAESAKLIAQEWKALNQDEKEKYNKLSSKDGDRYATEYKATYGYAPGILVGGNGTAQPRAAAAAA